MEYNIELKKATVTKLNIDVAIKETEAFSLDQNYHASLFEPKDPNDPTIMIHNSCTLKDRAGTQLSISMEADFIFQFTPIPQDWISVASECCPKIIQDKTKELVTSILHNMGHELAIGE